MRSISVLACVLAVVGAAASGDEAIRVGNGLAAPRLLKQARPDYPAQYNSNPMSALVFLDCVIAPDGTVAGGNILRGQLGFNEEAARAVRQWTYSPTYQDGKPVAVVLTVAVAFNVAGSESSYQMLHAALGDENEHVRERAAAMLGDEKRQTKEAAQLLAAALTDSSSRVRRAAAEALGVIGKKAKDALPALQRSMEDSDEHVRTASAAAIQKIGQASR
jgi:TonB family protein